MPENLMEGLLSEISRVKEIVIEYEQPYLKGAGIFAATLMKLDIQKAEDSIKELDTVRMIGCYQKLKEYER